MANNLIPYPSGGALKRHTQVGFRRDLWSPSDFGMKVFDDGFWGDAILGLYPAAKTNGASAAVTFTEHNLDGYVELVSGTDNDGYAGQGIGLQWSGDRGFLAEFLVKTPADVATFKMEVGVSDADDHAGAVLVKATPTATATDYAVFVVDTDDDTAIAFHSAKAGTIVASETIDGGSALAIAASTVYYVAIRVDGDNVEGEIRPGGVDGRRIRVAHGGNAGIEGGTALTPWAFCQARAISASRTVQLHRWRAQQLAVSS